MDELSIEGSRHLVATRTGTIGYPDDHAIAVAECSLRMAAHLALADEIRVTIVEGALLHDVGKLAVPPAVLLKRGPLTETEFEHVRRHPAAGVRMLRSLGAPREILPAVLHPHERWDGSGYPRGRAGERIPLEARILAIADSFDAMTSTRPYRAPRQVPDALDELHRCAGSQFDPDLVPMFTEAWAEGQLDVLVWQEAAAAS